MIVVGLLAATTISLSSDVFAVDKNYFGQSAKQLAQSDDGMGAHASDPDNDGDKGNDPGEHRSGIGNVGEDILGNNEKLHPSEVADCLDADGC